MDVRELARLFVYDPLACEAFIGKIIDTVDMDSNGALRLDSFSWYWYEVQFLLAKSVGYRLIFGFYVKFIESK